jgi:hypothetical protein
VPAQKRKSSVHQLEALTKNREFDLEDNNNNNNAAAKTRQQQQQQQDKEAVLQREKDKHERRQETKQRRRSSADLAADDAKVLTVSRYKVLWSSLQPAGSFQCKLREPVSTVTFTDHLAKQGFHVVFTSNPSPTDSEVGICNMRVQGTEPWFLARFLFTRTSMSAVMKAQDSTLVKEHVRNFALARVLRIDTSDAV